MAKWRQKKKKKGGGGEGEGRGERGGRGGGGGGVALVGGGVGGGGFVFLNPFPCALGYRALCSMHDIVPVCSPSPNLALTSSERVRGRPSYASGAILDKVEGCEGFCKS